MFSERGQNLIELLIVVSVLVFVVGALVFATIASLRNAQLAKNQIQATKLAQAGIERVRAARDRNEVVSILPSAVQSWDGDGSLGSSLWDYQIYSGCGNNNLSCYLKFSTSLGGGLIWISTSSTFPSSGAESLSSDQFKRAVILADRATCTTSGITVIDCYKREKEATVVVTWTDFSGPHQSRITTILRNLKI